MPNILGRFRFDVEKWKQAIEGDRESHAKAGLRFERVWQNADDPGEIWFMFEADDLEKAREFLRAAGALDREKQERGEIPTLYFLQTA